MSLGPNAPGLALGVAVLVACSVLLPGRRLHAARSSLMGAAIGSVIYPLALCLFMGVAGAMSGPVHGWVRFRFAFSIYAQSAFGESIPRGAVLGAFIATCWVLWRRGSARRSTGTPSDAADA